MPVMGFRRAERVSFQVVDGRAFLLGPDGAEMIVVNEVGAMVWDALDRDDEADSIARALLGEFDDVSVEQLEQDVRDFLDELTGLGLVVST